MSRVRFFAAYLAFAALSFGALLAVASEQAEEKPADSQAAAPAAPEKPWVDLENKMALLKSRREILSTTMTKLRDEKNTLKLGSPEMKAKQAEYLKTHREWKQVGEDFNKLLNQLRYRFPERIVKSSRIQTEAMQNKSVEELEAELGIDGQLNQMMRKMTDLYGIKAPEPEAPRAPVQRKGLEDSLTEEPQIIIRK